MDKSGKKEKKATKHLSKSPADTSVKKADKQKAPAEDKKKQQKTPAEAKKESKKPAEEKKQRAPSEKKQKKAPVEEVKKQNGPTAKKASPGAPTEYVVKPKRAQSAYLYFNTE